MVVTVCNVTFSLETAVDLLMVKLQGTGSSLMGVHCHLAVIMMFITVGSGSVNVSDGSTDNFTLTRLRNGEMYNISIVGTSEHFFSESVAWDPVVLTGTIIILII